MQSGRKEKGACEQVWLHQSLSISGSWADGSSLNQFKHTDGIQKKTPCGQG